jgi:hypothetical protein
VVGEKGFLHTSSATTPVSFAVLAPGQIKTVTWKVTPPTTENGGAGLVLQASYDAPDHACTRCRWPC